MGGPAAVHDQHRARHVAGGVGSQVESGALDLLELAPAFECDLLVDDPDGMLGVPVRDVHLGEERPRRDRIDRHAVSGPLQGQAAGQLDDGALRRGVGGAIGRRHQTERRCDVDDAAMARRLQVGRRRPTHRPRTGHVDGEGVLEVGLGQILDRSPDVDAGVVDQDVEATQLGGDRRH